MFKIITTLLLLVVLTACGGRNDESQNGYDAGETTEPPTIGSHEPPPYDEPEPEQAPEGPAYNEYRVDLEIDPQTRTVQGISRITFTNRTGKELDTIVLRVYLNAFREGFEPPPFFSELERRIFHRERGYGYMNIQYVSIDNQSVEYVLDGTVLTLELYEPLMPDVSVQLLLQYDAFVPQIAHRTGGNDIAMWFGMFLPMLSVFDENGWRTEAHYPAGSPFILETANFHVAITTPIRYMVVGTGQRAEEVIEDTDIKITRFTAGAARDFAFAVSPYFNHAHAVTESGIDIHLYYYTKALRIDDIMELAHRSVKHFERRVGTFPLGHITIVETEQMRDSEAFSQVVFVDSRYLRQNNLWALAHGIGNQWFANVVGTNRIAEPWLSEGLTRFVQAGIFDSPEDLRARMEREYYAVTGRDDLYISAGLWAYGTWNHFTLAQERKAALMVYALYRRVGEENFWSLINRYYQSFSFRFATANDFFRLAEEVYGGSLEAFFDEWMNSGDVPPLE